MDDSQVEITHLRLQAYEWRDRAQRALILCEEFKKDIMALRKECADLQECYHQCNEVIAKLSKENARLNAEIISGNAIIPDAKPIPVEMPKVVRWDWYGDDMKEARYGIYVEYLDYEKLFKKLNNQ